MNDEKLSYEQAIEKLTKIVETLSSQSVTLEKATKLFEEGVELIKICYAGLNVAKGKILEIKNTLDGLKIEEVEN